MVAVEIAKRNLFFRIKMVRNGAAVFEDRQDAAEMDSVVQARAGRLGGELCKSVGDPSKLTASDQVEDSGEKLVIRVGAIGFSAFGYKCSFGSA